MSAFSKRLAAEFETEFARLANDWFSRWHALMRGEPAMLDDFRGGALQPPSRSFDAATRQAYWTAIRHYIDGKIAITFHRIEHEIRLRGSQRALHTVEESTIALRSYLERLYRYAVFTEYRLQARGYPDERYLARRRDRLALHEIQRRKMALLEKYSSTPWAWRLAEAAREAVDRHTAGTVALFMLMGGSILMLLR